jgi:hypothetical protein
MNELMELVDNLKKELDKKDEIIDIKKYNKIISCDKELLKDIEEYNKTMDSNIKNRILSNENFNLYKEKETNLNFLILEINSKLKKINIKKDCFK